MIKSIYEWEVYFGRSLTFEELELYLLTEGDIDFRLGYCPSLYGV